MKATKATWRLDLLTMGLLVLCQSATVRAQESGGISPAGRVIPHRHDPIDIDARPIVSRVSVELVQPRRMLMDRLGNLFIADWGAGTVLKRSRKGRVTVIAEGLNEPAGLAMDSEDNIYVSTHAAGMTRLGAVVRITPMGEQSVYASGLTGPTALAFDAMENLFVANFHDNNIAVIRMEGEVDVFVENIPSPAAIAFDSSGTLYVTSSTEGTLSAITPMGEVSLVARGMFVPSDIAFDPQGHLIVTNYAGTELTYVSKKGNVKTFALVPKGTISACFDSKGNVFLLNWDEPMLLNVISHLSVPCPHCEKHIPLRLRPKIKKPKSAKPKQSVI